MPDMLRLALAQLNPAVGDIDGNLSKLRDLRRSVSDKADVLMTSELFLSGYPPEDLVIKPSFQSALREGIEALAEDTANGGPAILIGTPWCENEKLYNAMLVLDGGKVTGKIFKRDLPNYGPFDEKRVFQSGPLPEPIFLRGHHLGVLICEDLWTPDSARYLHEMGAHILLVPNGSPYESNKFAERKAIARRRVHETNLPVVYLNQVGGQDELVFDGASFVLNASGGCVANMKPWQTDCLTLSVEAISALPGIEEIPENTESQIYNALMLGLRDYVNKNGFPGVVLGMSGGIDSAVVAALAVDALGADKVWTVMMPSPFTSQDSLDDAMQAAKILGCRHDTVAITDMMQSFDQSLKPLFISHVPDVTEENIQARCRGVTLMALSNKFGAMVLSTGNKSEMSVGYSTLYGDLCGGFAVLKDVYKTEVYEIARWRNTHKPENALGPKGAIIPERILTKAPTAELRPNQTDQDSLPPYDILDAILERMIERDLSVHDIVALGYDLETVRRVWSMLDRAEYKRRQAPPGVKITRRHLGKDRRYPITNLYREHD
jgi:NAD+ synthase